MTRMFRRLAAAGGLVAALVLAPAAMADGTETLGPPSIAIAEGTGAVAAGVGTQQFRNAPVSFDIEVPAGASVEQVLAYWEGHVSATDFSPDTTISLNGQSVEGTLIGGPTDFFGDEHFSTYRADVTGLGLVTAGTNTITVSDMEFLSYHTTPTGNGGAGLLVIYDDGTPSTLAGVRDGSDLAYADFGAPLNATVPQTFTFAASATGRTGTLGVIAGSVSGPDLEGVRGNVITGEFDTGETFSFTNELQSTDGDEFDTLNLPIAVPANATSVTVEVASEGGVRPASLDWIGAALSIDNPPPPPEEPYKPHHDKHKWLVWLKWLKKYWGHKYGDKDKHSKYSKYFGGHHGDDDDCKPDDDDCKDRGHDKKWWDHDNCKPDDDDCKDKYSKYGGKHDDCRDDECKDKYSKYSKYSKYGGKHDDCRDDDECKDKSSKYSKYSKYGGKRDDCKDRDRDHDYGKDKYSWGWH